MNTGVISKRYAKALLEYVRQTGRGAEVCAQVRSLLKDPRSVPASEMEPDLQRFILLISRRGRTEYLRFIFASFVKMYLDSEGIKIARLRTVVRSEAIEARLQDILAARTGCRIILETTTDPSIVGGFVLEVDGYMLDASVASQIERIRRAFVSDINRIV